MYRSVMVPISSWAFAALPISVSTSRRTPWSTYRFIPSGGLMRDASTRINMIIPNQTKSTPIAIKAGARIGTVVTSIAKLSMKVPNSM